MAVTPVSDPLSSLSLASIFLDLKIKSPDDIGVTVAYPNSYPQYFPAAPIHTTIYCNWKSTVLVSHQFMVTIEGVHPV